MTTLEQSQEIAATVAEIAQENLKKDGYLTPTAFLVWGGKIGAMVVLQFSGPDTKRQSIATVSRLAVEHNAEVVIVITDAYLKASNIDLENYEHGQLAVDPEATECITVGIKGPDVGSWVRCLPYRRTDVGDIEFCAHGDVPASFLEGEINTIQDWWTLPKDR